MKSKKIKNTLLVVLTLAIVAAASVAITFAAVSANLGSAENTFSNDEITVEISEQKWDGTPGTGETNLNITTEKLGKTIAQSYSSEMIIPKNPMLTNISETAGTVGGDPKIWVAIKATYTAEIKVDGVTTEYTYTGSLFEQAIAKLYTGEDKDTATEGLGTGWSANSDKTVFYYADTVANRNSTNRLFDFVKINAIEPEASGTYAGKYKILAPNGSNLYADELPEFHITLKGYAVQYDTTNVDTAVKAKTPLDTLIDADS